MTIIRDDSGREQNLRMRAMSSSTKLAGQRMPSSARLLIAGINANWWWFNPPEKWHIIYIYVCVKVIGIILPFLWLKISVNQNQICKSVSGRDASQSHLLSSLPVRWLHWGKGVLVVLYNGLFEILSRFSSITCAAVWSLGLHYPTFSRVDLDFGHFWQSRSKSINPDCRKKTAIRWTEQAPPWFNA